MGRTIISLALLAWHTSIINSKRNFYKFIITNYPKKTNLSKSPKDIYYSLTARVQYVRTKFKLEILCNTNREEEKKEGHRQRSLLRIFDRYTERSLCADYRIG